MQNTKKAFTLIEMIAVIAIVGVLMMATVVYIGLSDENRKVIEAQGCVSTLGGEISNYVFYALTSKNLRNNDDERVFPVSYIIQITGNNAICSGGVRAGGEHCDILNFLYLSGADATTPELYRTYSPSRNCRGNNTRLSFYRSGTSDNIDYIEMKKGFMQTSVNEKVFYLQDANGTNKLLLGDIIIGLCLNNDCSNPREISKRIVDGRSQTISTRNCKFYDNTDSTRCRERES